MAKYSAEDIKRLRSNTNTSTKATTSKYTADDVKKIRQETNTIKSLQMQKEAALREKNAPNTVNINKTQQGNSTITALQKQKESKLKDINEKNPSTKIPYVETFKEVPKNFSSGDILGGLGNAAKGTGQMLLQGLSVPQKLIQTIPKGIQTGDWMPDPNLTTEEYVKKVAPDHSDKLLNTKAGTFATGMFNIMSDPLTWVGGGIADDALKLSAAGTQGLVRDAKLGENILQQQAKKQLGKQINGITDNALNASQTAKNTNNINANPILENQPTKANRSLVEPMNLNNVKQANDLPNDVDNLKSFVDNMAEQQRKGIKINLQLFAEAQAKLRKLSKVKSNTLAKTNMLTQAEKNMLDDADFMYDLKSEKESISEAQRRLKTDYQGEINNLNSKETFSGSDVDAMFDVVATERDIARQTGDYSKVKSMLKNTRKAGTEGGRTIQAFAKYSRTTEGALVDAQRAVDSVEDGLRKTNPAKVKKIDDETKKVTDAIDLANKEAAKQVKKEISPEELLANRVSSTLKTNVKKTNPVTDMVNELFKSAKESPLPERAAAIKRNPIEFLTQAIQNKGEYADVWEKARVILKDKYSNDPASLSVLDNYFNKGIVPTYSQGTLNNSVKTSMKDLSQKLDDIAKSSKGNKEQSLKELTDYLITETGSTLDDATLLAQRIQTRFDELVKEKSGSILKQMFKEIPQKGQKTTYQKVMELINLGGYDDNAIRDLIKKKEGLPILENSDIQKISKYMDKAKDFAEDSYENSMWVSKAQQIIADKIPASAYEKFRGLQRISLILNPKSLITRNPLGNTILGVAETVKDVPGAMIDKVVSLATKERTTALNPVNKLRGQYEGFKQGLSEFGKDIRNNVDTSPTRGQLELPSGRTFNNKTLNAIDQFERKALQLGDRPFYQAAYNGRLAELKGLGRTIDDTAKAEAKLYALDRVFQGNSVLAKKAKELKSSLGIIGDIVIPFTQTPANVMDKLVDYTPGGLMKALSQIGTMGKGTFNQKLFVDRLGRSVTGTGLGLLGYVMAQKGIITGGRNADKDVANYEQSLGKNPYAVKLGDKYYTFDWAQPIAGLLASGADAYQAGKDKKDFLSSIGAGATAAGNTLINQSFLQGVVSLMSGYSPIAGLTKTALSAPLQAAPTFTSNIAKQIDPYVRETYDPNPLKQTANKFVAKTPFASKTLPRKVDQSGQEIKQQQGAGPIQKAFNLFISPGVSTTFKPDETQKEILRLYNEAGTKIQVPTSVEKYISETKDHPRINLTAEEYIQYQKRTGELTINGGTIGNGLPFNGFKNIMQQDRYRNAKPTKDKTVDEVRADMLADVIEKAKAAAKKEILQQRGYKK